MLILQSPIGKVSIKYACMHICILPSIFTLFFFLVSLNSKRIARELDGRGGTGTAALAIFLFVKDWAQYCCPNKLGCSSYSVPLLQQPLLVGKQGDMIIYFMATRDILD